MTTQEIANRLVELCRAGQYGQAQEELYADEAMSIEPIEAMAPTVDGLEAIKDKGRNFQARIKEMRSNEVSDPIVAGNYFSVTGKMTATMHDDNEMVMEEICLYKVQDGKIISEQFFY